MSVPKWMAERLAKVAAERAQAALVANALVAVANNVPTLAIPVPPVANKASTPVANAQASRYKDLDRRRAYMRDLMRRRRAAARAPLAESSSATRLDHARP